MIATYEGLNTVIPRLIKDVKMERYIATAAKNKQGIALANAKIDVLNTIEKPDDFYRIRGEILARITMEKILLHGRKTSKLLELEAKNAILDQVHSACISPRTVSF